MDRRIIEICYDIAASSEVIHGLRPGRGPRAFRDSAGCFVEAALRSAGLGRLIDVSSALDEVRVRFEVVDFDLAEQAVCRAVCATPFANFREILRYWDKMPEAA